MKEAVEAEGVLLRLGVDLWIMEDLFDLKVEGVLDEVTLPIEVLVDSTDLCTLLLGGDRAKLPTLAFVTVALVVVAAFAATAAVEEGVVFLLIILFGDVRLCKNGLFCTETFGGLLSIFFEGCCFREAAFSPAVRGRP